MCSLVDALSQLHIFRVRLTVGRERREDKLHGLFSSEGTLSGKTVGTLPLPPNFQESPPPFAIPPIEFTDILDSAAVLEPARPCILQIYRTLFLARHASHYGISIVNSEHPQRAVPVAPLLILVILSSLSSLFISSTLSSFDDRDRENSHPLIDLYPLFPVLPTDSTHLCPCVNSCRTEGDPRAPSERSTKHNIAPGAITHSQEEQEK